jgi:hypothetical protein
MKKIAGLTIALLTATQLFALSDADNKTLHNLLIKFYGYQRAGLKSGSCYNLNANFANASHNGDNYSGNPLDGGWYDAGDYIKFGMNLSYSVYCLLKGYDVFPTGYDDLYSWDHSSKADGVPDILNQVKFATDYIMKAVISESQVVLDVGDANSEHGDLGVANNSAGRSAGQVRLCTGGDIPATYAACLALMSTVYRKFDATYADQCLAKAKTAFTFAKNKYAANAAVSQPQGTFYTYPTISGNTTIPVNDRKVAAGAEIYRAIEAAKQTQDPIYKTWAKLPISGLSDCMGYAYIGPLSSVAAWQAGLISGPTELLTNVGFIGSKIKETGKFNKVYQNGGWGTARDAGTAAFEMALAYVFYADQPTRTSLLEKVNNHISWIVGKGANNSQSYVCGFNGGPTQAHYRSTQWKAVPGGVVAGPDPSGNWEDNWSNYKYSEVAIDYNAGITGAVAFLRAITNPGDDVKMSAPFTASSKIVDLTKGDVKFTGTFSKSVKWNIKLSGASGLKTYTGTGTSISQTWDGSADQGTILGGDQVVASLSIDGARIVSYDVAFASPIQIDVMKNKKTTPKANDKLLDDFDDGTMPNKIAGTWSAFGSGTGASITTASITMDSGSNALVMSGAVRTNDNKNWAGLKTTFTGDGSAVGIGSVKSILFDMRSNKPTTVSVELEQASITDKAYHQAVVPVMTISNRYRVNISDFAQPDWKTGEKALDLNNITALRFTIYDSTGMIKLYLDNVYVEDLAVAPVAVSLNPVHKEYNQIHSNGTLYYSIPQTLTDKFSVTVFNAAGKSVLTRSFANCAGQSISLPLTQLPSGMYTVVNSMNNRPYGQNMTIIHTK